jgi:uncharacterized lipoprotein YmbA
MIHAHARRIVALVLAIGVLALAACRSVEDPTKYYVLSPTSPPEPTPRAASSSTAIGVGPVLIPGYLDRVQIVTRGAEDEVELSPYHRWAEPIESGIAKVVADNLALLVGSERIAVFPWRGGVARLLDYQVVIVVLRFEGAPGRQVTLDARWRLLGKAGQELVLKRSTINEPVIAEGYQPLVRGMNQALAALAREIAAEIQSHASTQAAGS